MPSASRASSGAARQIAARLERLDEDLYAGTDPAIAADIVSARTTRLTTLTLGANA